MTDGALEGSGRNRAEGRCGADHTSDLAAVEGTVSDGDVSSRTQELFRFPRVVVPSAKTDLDFLAPRDPSPVTTGGTTPRGLIFGGALGRPFINQA
jgi:hypothetical protein